MRRLRQKLGEYSGDSVIENVHGVGYRMRSKKKSEQQYMEFGVPDTALTPFSFKHSTQVQ
jgi:hypothetical protein